jgi:perosamine synthetase
MLGLRTLDRRKVYEELHAKSLGVNVHYIPVHLQPWYRKRYAYTEGDFPQAEAYYRQTLTIPLYPAMSAHDEIYVAHVFNKILKSSP